MKTKREKKIGDNASAFGLKINIEKTTEIIHIHFVCLIMRIVIIIIYCYLPEQQSIAGYFALKNSRSWMLQ